MTDQDYLSTLQHVKWGSASAAYQIEGATSQDGRTPSIWDTFAATPGATTRGDTGDIACDSYRHPERILEAIEWLGLDTYRFSISWSRLIPNPDGVPNPPAVAYYRRLLENLHQQGVTSVVTLYHWDLPQWLQDKGGWTSLETVAAFRLFAQTAVQLFGDLVTNWITVNEPYCAAFHGHLSGLHAPGTRCEQIALRATLVLLQAHAEATQAIRTVDPQAHVSLALNLSDLVPASDSEADIKATSRADLIENRLFLDPILTGCLPADAEQYFGAKPLADALTGIDLDAINTPLDFIGVNYYEHNRIQASPDDHDLIIRGVRKLSNPQPCSANGVAVCPSGFTRVLTRVATMAPQLPIWVTECGIGLWDYIGPYQQCHDTERVDFLAAYMPALADAIVAGAKVEAFMLWALMDNFEWSNGYQLRYGLFYTDFANGHLSPKNSAHWYRDHIKRCHWVAPEEQVHEPRN